MKDVDKLLDNYIENKEIAGAAICIRRQGKIALKKYYGLADLKNQKPVNEMTIFRLASMTKPIIAVAIMILVERGQLTLDDPLSKFFPECERMAVVRIGNKTQQYYKADKENPLLAKMEVIQNEVYGMVETKNIPVIEDLLRHRSGIGMGITSEKELRRIAAEFQTLEERVREYLKCPLDFFPGEMTGYSAVMAFDILGRIIEIVSGKSLQDFLATEIFIPLGMKNTGYIFNEKDRQRIAILYECSEYILKDVTNDEALWKMINPLKNSCYSGSAGLLGTLEDYDKFVQMLYLEGEFNHERILSKEMVKQMEQPDLIRSLNPGVHWGLGMAIFKEPQKTNRILEKNTFGWSGAYGTHFFIDRKNEITMTLMINRSNIGGADSYISWEIEKTIMKSINK